MSAEIFVSNIFNPVGILVDPDGNILVNSDQANNNTLTQLTPDGTEM